MGGPPEPDLGAAAMPLRDRHVAVVNWRDLDHTYAGGSEIYAWESALALQAAGARVEFLTARDRHQSAHGVRDGVAISRGGGPFTFYLWVAAALLRRRRRLDLVIDAESGIPAWSPLWVARRTRVVLVMHHVHQEQFATHFPSPVARVGQFLERVVMRRVYRGRRTLAVSDSTRAEMQERLGWREPVDVLLNGAAAPPPSDGLPGADKDPDRVLVLGRLVAHKRVDVVIRAVGRLVARRPQLHLDVCGSGPESERLAALVAELGLDDRVHLHGYLAEADKAALLRRASLHVCASDKEGWGQTVIEAAGWGVPTVARDVPGLRDSIRDGVTGWLVPDAEDLDVVERRITAQLSAALDETGDPDRRRRRVEDCREWASRFSWSRMRAEMLDVVVAELDSADPSGGRVRRH